MSTEQKQPSLITKNLVNNAVLSKKLSISYMKQIIPITISSIIYHRVELENKNDDFSSRTFKGIPYKVLRSKVKDSDLKSIKQSIQGVLDAFEKDCLKEVYLVFCNKKNSDEIYESYKLDMKYFDIDNNFENKQNIKAKLMDHTMELLHSLGSLCNRIRFKTDDVFLKMVLTYYDDKTPVNYKPQYFEMIDDMETVWKVINHQEETSNKLYLSVLRTGHHTMKCSTGLQLKDFLESGTESEFDQVTIDEVTEPDETMETEMQDVIEIETESQTAAVEITAPAETIVESENDQLTTADLSFDVIEIEDEVAPTTIKCPCNILCRISHIEAICCSKCNTLQHCPCIGYLRGSQVPSFYVCYECNNGSSISSKWKKTWEFYSVLRLTLTYIYFTKSFPNEVYNKLALDMQQHLLTKLIGIKFVQENDNGYNVDVSRIAQALPNFFVESMRMCQGKRGAISDSMELDDTSCKKPRHA